MSEGTSFGLKFTFLDYVGLAFILPAGEEILRRPTTGWPVYIPGFILGLTALAFRNKSPQIQAWFVNWFRAPEKLAEVATELTALRARLDESRMPAVDRKPSRLKIIEARYGIEGGPDADVAEEYLRPRILGDSLAGWVGADLFGGFQPVIGRAKRVKVRYSFDGAEATVERPEHALLILPEDKFLKEQIETLRTVLGSQIVITNLRSDDLRIEPSFFDGRRLPIGGVESLELKNRGGREAYSIRICPIRLKNLTIRFPQIVESLPPTDFIVNTRGDIYLPPRFVIGISCPFLVQCFDELFLSIGPPFRANISQNRTILF